MAYRPFQAEAQGHAHTLYQVAYMRTGMSHIHGCARGIGACEQRPGREVVSACARVCGINARITYRRPALFRLRHDDDAVFLVALRKNAAGADARDLLEVGGFGCRV